MPNLCQGRLVWVEVTGLDGRAKRRPVIITTPDTDLASAVELAGIACSHSAVFRNPRPADYFEMPYHPSGRCGSKLTKPTIAICRWMPIARRGLGHRKPVTRDDVKMILEASRPIAHSQG